MRKLIVAACVASAFFGSSGHAQIIYPIDRAEMLVDARFDFKVEFSGPVDPTKVLVTINGKDHSTVFLRPLIIVEGEDNRNQSAVLLRDVSLSEPGVYKVRASDGASIREITWNVYATGPRKAKNVILFIGDGMSAAHRTAARLLSKGIAEGKSFGKLAIDDMPRMALVVVELFCFSTPRIIMQKCRASQITPTPRGSQISSIASATS